MKTVTLGRTAVVQYDFALEYADPSKVPIEPLTSPIKADNKTISFPGTATIEGKVQEWSRGMTPAKTTLYVRVHPLIT